ITPSPPGSVSTWYLRPAAPLRNTKSSRAAAAPFTIRISVVALAACAGGVCIGAARAETVWASVRQHHPFASAPAATAVKALNTPRLLVVILAPLCAICVSLVGVGQSPRFSIGLRRFGIPAELAQFAAKQCVQRALLVRIARGQ